MNIQKIGILGLILTLSLACNTAKTQETATEDAVESVKRGPKQGAQKQKGSDRQEALKALITDLGLTSDQEAEFKAIQKKYRGQMQKVRNNSQGDRQAMRSSMEEIREKQDTELKALLDKDQFTKYQKWLEENRPQRGRKPPRGN